MMSLSATPARPENLWLKAIREFWADPKNIIGGPGELIKRLVRLTWLVVTVYLLFWVAGPSQVKSLQLWMSDQELAKNIGWCFTYASALAFSVVAYAAAETEPFRFPVPFPERIWPLNKWRWVHVHVANIRVTAGSAVVAMLLATQLYVMYNYYTHENMTASDASAHALSGSDNRVAELEQSLHEGQERWAASDREAGAALAAAPANYVTARSRIMAERRQAASAWSTERARLEEALRAARAETVTTRQTFTDPRPADGQLAATLGISRPVMAAISDLMRSVVVESLLILGLGMVVHPGRKPAETVSREKQSEVEEVAETPPAPAEVPRARSRPRFTLPTATDEDFAQAIIIGPRAHVSMSEPPKQAEEQEAPVGEPEAAEEAIDPLIAARMARANEETVNG